VVVLDGAGYSRENLRALEGEFPREAWTPLLPGYRGLEVEADYGGVI
jgi:hypothetical protein